MMLDAVRGLDGVALLLGFALLLRRGGLAWTCTAQAGVATLAAACAGSLALGGATLAAGLVLARAMRRMPADGPDRGNAAWLATAGAGLAALAVAGLPGQAELSLPVAVVLLGLMLAAGRALLPGVLAMGNGLVLAAAAVPELAGAAALPPAWAALVLAALHRPSCPASP